MEGRNRARKNGHPLRKSKRMEDVGPLGRGWAQRQQQLLRRAVAARRAKIIIFLIMVASLEIGAAFGEIQFSGGCEWVCSR